MKKVREKVAIAVAIASITTISSFVISNGKKVYAEEVRVTATANIDKVKDNGKQLKNEITKVNTQEDKDIKDKDLKTDREKDVKEVEVNALKDVESKTEKINKDKSLEKNNDKVSIKLESSDEDVKEIKNDKDIKDKDAKEVKHENVEKVNNNEKYTVKEVENKTNQNQTDRDKIKQDKKVEVKSEEIKTKDNEISKKDEEVKKSEEKIQVEKKEEQSNLDKNEALKSDYININKSEQPAKVGTESQNNSATDENKKDGWQTIGGKTYYFENGKVSTGKKEVYDTNNGAYKTYFFNEDGTLVNKPGICTYTEYWGEKRKVYVNNKGEVESGWKTIDGKTYYFHQYNGMAINICDIFNGDKKETYLFDEDGVLRKGNGLKEIDGKWYYFNKNNSLVSGWKTIDGKMYYFDTYNGRAKGSTRIYDSNHEKYKLYFFNEDGVLITKPGIHTCHESWGGERKRYVNNRGEIQSGWQTIDGKTYYFDEDNGMATWVHEIHDGDKNKLYLFDKDGVLVQGNGWKELDGRWYYLNKDNSLESGWKKIDGKTYYFDAYNGRAKGSIRIYDSNHEKYKLYFFNEDGVLITKPGIHTCHESWGGERKRYVNNRGEIQSGWQTIDGKTYYFDEDNGMATWVHEIHDGDKNKLYLFDKDGVLVEGNGWKKLDGRWYYFNNDNSLVDGWKIINGKKYYLNKYNGMATGVCEINNDNKNKLYLFDEDGALVEGNGWKKLGERWYYLNNDNSLADGWKTINGKKYYLDKYNGMANGISYINIGGKSEVYLFTNDGSLITGNGWREIGGKWYYFNDNNSLANGWKTINGKTYYFNCNMSVGVSKIYNYNTSKEDLYYFKEDGELIKKKGWEKLNGHWYYFNEDSSLKTNWQTIGGKKYYFNERTGIMAAGQTTIYDYFNNEDKIYCFTSDGSLLEKKGWLCKYNNYQKVWCYIDENGALKKGYQTIDGKDYYFNYNGEMETGIVNIGVFKDDPKCYYFDNSGVLLKNEGWKKINGQWYYLNKDGSLFKGWKKSGSDWYYLDRNYEMVNGPIKVIDHRKLDSDVYYFNEDGKLTNRTGWINHISGEYNDWYYVENGGKAVLGWNRINGAWYYFDEDAKMVTAPTRIFDKDSSNDKIYFFDNSGSYRKYSGWYEHKPVDGEPCWYYFGEDGFAKTSWQIINGNKYYFNSDGVMAKGVSTIFENEVQGGTYSVELPTYLFNESGALVTNEGWHKITLYNEEKWCYTDNTGLCKKGLAKINNKYYYFGSDCLMETGVFSVSGLNGERDVICFFDNSGVLNTSKGWHKCKDKYDKFETWCYIDDNGNLAEGLKEIDGKQYYFREGTMRTGFVRIDEDEYYFDESGAMAKGWSQDKNGQYYYTDSNGILQKGWQRINGAWYYFDEVGVMATGPKYILDESTYETKLYYFDNSGAFKYKKGWVNNIGKYNNDWYYINSDNELAMGWQRINGTWYYFDEVGVMATGLRYILDESTYETKLYYFDNSGAFKYKKGWVNIDRDNNEFWYYINSNNELATGWKKINGTWYYFYESGEMAKGLVSLSDSNGNYVEYCFNNNGAWVTNPGWHSWQEDNYTHWVYINDDGNLAEGWKKINNRWYYFYKETKRMATGVVKEWDYKTNTPYIQHFFSEDGSWDSSEGWKSYQDLQSSPDLEWAYVEANGRLASGWKKIGGQWYYFDEGTGFMVKGTRHIDGKLYEFNSNGTLKN